MEKCLIFLSFLVFPFTCATKPDPTPVWSFEPKGIQIRYSADNMLNVFDGKPHTLVLVVYQLAGLEAFNSLAKDEDGLRKLLEGERFDPSVISADKIIVQPATKNEVFFDRFENVRWVGIVAGYYGLTPGQVNQTFKIPFTIEKKGRIWKKKIANVNQLTIDLFLGPHEFHKVGTS